MERAEAFAHFPVTGRSRSFVQAGIPMVPRPHAVSVFAVLAQGPPQVLTDAKAQGDKDIPRAGASAAVASWILATQGTSQKDAAGGPGDEQRAQ